MKHYTLTKETLFELPIKKVHYTSKTSYKAFEKKPKKIIIHHTKTLNTLEKVYLHFKKKHNDTSIGYHIMIGKNGQYYLTRPLQYIGNHTPFFNDSSIGIGIFGNFNTKWPSEKQIESLKKICTLLKKKYSIQTCDSHNSAIYELLKQKINTPIPEMNETAIENDISYYSFLKRLHSKVKEQKSDEITSIFNEMQSCPGIHLQQKINKLKI